MLMGSKKLTKKQESDICLECGECCRRCRITLLPEDVEKISKKLKISRKRFMDNHCELFVKLYPKSTPGVLTYPTAFFPKRVHRILKVELGIVPPSFFVVPQIVLNREGGECVFLDEGNECEIYSARPEPCRLFPFIAVPGYRESYPFCPLFKRESRDYSKKSGAFYKKVKKYFYDVNKKGFKKYWRTPPEKGILFLAEKKIGKISLGDLEVIQGAYT